MDREVDGTPKVTLLKTVQAAGTKVSLYGSVEAKRIMDKWTLETPDIQVGLNQFGTPRGNFPAQSYLTDSEEASKALAQQAANLEQQRKELKARREQEEKDRQAREEEQAREEKARKDREAQNQKELDEQRQATIVQQKKEDDEKKAKAEAAFHELMLATVPGSSYIGTISVENKSIIKFFLLFYLFTMKK